MATTRKLTLEEFLSLPEASPASEFIDGEVRQKPMPNGVHATVERLLSFVITLFLRDHPIGEAGSEWRCVFGPPGRERAWVPDFVFIAHEHLAEGEMERAHYGPPDLAVEILSPDDRASDVLDKISFYVAHGVRLLWVIDPRLRTVAVYTAGGRTGTLTENDALDGGDVLPGFITGVRDILPPDVGGRSGVSA